MDLNKFTKHVTQWFAPLSPKFNYRYVVIGLDNDYAKKYYNGLKLLNFKKALYFWYNPIFLSKDKILQVVLNDDLTGIDNDNGFLNTKTIYKLKGDD